MAEVVKIEFTEEENWAIKYAKDYSNDIAGIEKYISESEPRRFCIVQIYKWFIRNKGLKKFDDLEVGLKEDILNDSKNIFPQEMDELRRKQICIFLYFMNHIFENYL